MKNCELAAYSIVILLLAGNLYMSLQVQGKVDQFQASCMPKKSLPCESVPISWAVKNYNCANSLLMAMNVTNVKFNSPGASNLLRYNRSVSTVKS